MIMKLLGGGLLSCLLLVPTVAKAEGTEGTQGTKGTQETKRENVLLVTFVSLSFCQEDL